MTDPQQFLADLEAGVFSSKVAAAITEAARGTIGHSKNGKVTITLEFKPIGSSRQVEVVHKLAYVAPTARGKLTEEDIGETPMHVNMDGSVTVFPANQPDFFKAGAAGKETVK